MIRKTALSLALLSISCLSGVSSGSADEPSGLRPLIDWAGLWRAGDEQEIVIMMEDEDTSLQLDGYASYGMTDPARRAAGNVHIGVFSVRIPQDEIGARDTIRFHVAPDGQVAAEDADPADCMIDMALVGDYLDVRDNGRCGGNNVTFTGTYSKPRATGQIWPET